MKHYDARLKSPNTIGASSASFSVYAERVTQYGQYWSSTQHSALHWVYRK